MNDCKRGTPRNGTGPRELMSPALLVYTVLKPACGRGRLPPHSRPGWTRRTSAATGAGVHAFPWLMRMAFTNPAQVTANYAFHRRKIPFAWWAAVIWGTWITVFSRRWLSKTSPQGTSSTSSASATATARLFPTSHISARANRARGARLQVGLGPFRDEHQPCFLEGGAGLVEGWRRAVGAFARGLPG
jgi:hypothetical protein